MADLTIDATAVALVRVEGEDGLLTGPANAAIDAGKFAAPGTNGKIAAQAGAATVGDNGGGVAINTAKVANQSISILKRGIVNLGTALDGLAYGAAVFTSANAGSLADATAANQVQIGEVVPGYGSTTPGKLLRVNI